MALKLPKIFGNRGAQPETHDLSTPLHAEKNQDISEMAGGDTTNQRGSVQFEDVQVGRAIPEVGDEVVVSMLNNKNPELNRYENMDQDGNFGPEVLSLDKSSPKLAEAVALVDTASATDVDTNAKSTPVMAELGMAVDPQTQGEGILPYLEQQPYHGGGEAAQDVFVTEAVAPAQDVFVTEVVSPPPTEGQVSVFGVGGGVDEAARSSGSVMDPGAVLGDDVQFTGSDEELGALIAWLRNRNLIDTSTGEIVWADEARSEESSEVVAWLRDRGLIDTSTGEIVWVRQPAEGFKWYVPDMDSDQSGMAIEKDQVFVGGFGGGVDDDRVVQPEQPQSLYFEDSVRTAREVAAGDVNNDGAASILGDAPSGGSWGHGDDTLGAASLLNESPMAEPLSLNFEEIKVTVIDTIEADLDAPEVDIELPG